MACKRVFETITEFIRVIKTAWIFSETNVFTYSKAYDIVEPVLVYMHKADLIPKNFEINISIYHEQGIDVYNRLKDIPCVKAFVILDNEWDVAMYKAHGLDIDTICNAYDSEGKLNHNLTCDKCKKCMSRKACHKVTGCFEH